jgi:hypothetical protein
MSGAAIRITCMPIEIPKPIPLDRDEIRAPRSGRGSVPVDNWAEGRPDAPSLPLHCCRRAQPAPILLRSLRFCILHAARFSHPPTTPTRRPASGREEKTRRTYPAAYGRAIRERSTLTADEPVAYSDVSPEPEGVRKPVVSPEGVRTGARAPRPNSGQLRCRGNPGGMGPRSSGVP